MIIPDTGAVTALARGHNSAATVDDLGSTTAATVGTTIRDGHGGPDICHALYCPLPRAEFAGIPILLTDNEDAYPPDIIAVDTDSPGTLAFS
ncbi:hypothetical protein ACU686_19755 [Yinghuangia aomiensis]